MQYQVILKMTTLKGYCELASAKGVVDKVKCVVFIEVQVPATVAVGEAKILVNKLKVRVEKHTRRLFEYCP